MSYCYVYYDTSTCLYMLSNHVDLPVYLLVYIIFLIVAKLFWGGPKQNLTIIYTNLT
jgi:hypothetical protein